MKPSALKALVDQQSQEPDFGPMVGGMNASPDDGMDDEEEPEDEEPTQDPLERGTELLGQWGEQGDVLKESAGEFVDSAHEIGGNLILDNPPEEATEEVEDQYESLPDDIKVALAQRVAPLDAGDTTALVTALISGQDGETEEPDVKLVTAYVKALAAHAAEDVSPDDFVEDEEDDEDGDGDGDGDEDAPPADAAPAGQSSAAQQAPSKPLA